MQLILLVIILFIFHFFTSYMGLKWSSSQSYANNRYSNSIFDKKQRLREEHQRQLNLISRHPKLIVYCRICSTSKRKKLAELTKELVEKSLNDQRILQIFDRNFTKAERDYKIRRYPALVLDTIDGSNKYDQQWPWSDEQVHIWFNRSKTFMQMLR